MNLLFSERNEGFTVNGRRSRHRRQRMFRAAGSDLGC